MKNRSVGRWVAIGTAVDAGVGVAVRNLAVGVGGGIAVGAVVGLLLARRAEPKA